MKYRIGIYTIIASILLLNLILSSGCLDTQNETDSFVTKIHHDGTLAWVKVIDSGENDVTTDLIETSEGDYVLSGGGYSPGCGYFADFHNGRLPMTTHRLIRLSSDGNVVWIQNYPSYENLEGLISVLQKPDGGFESVSEFGEIITTDKEGTLVGKYSPIESDYVVPQRWINARKIHDGGYILSGIVPIDQIKFGPYFARIDKNGTWIWREIYPVISYPPKTSVWERDGNKGNFAAPISQVKNDKGWSVSITTIDTDGNFFNKGIIIPSSDIPQVFPVARSGKDDIFFYVSEFPDRTTEYSDYEWMDPTDSFLRNAGYPFQNAVYLDSSGVVINQSTVYDIKGRIYLESSDGGFISAYPKTKGITEYLMIAKSDADGNNQWECPSLTLSSPLFSTDAQDTVRIQRVIQTSDGDYIVWGNREKKTPCFYIGMN